MSSAALGITAVALDEKDTELVLSALSSAYTYALDAYAHCLLDRGEPRVEPDLEAAQRNRWTLDRIERIATELGSTMRSHRRADIESKARAIT